MDILSPDKIKLEPGTDISVPSTSVVTLANTSTSGRVMTLVSKSSTTGLTPNQKTILLVQAVGSKAGVNSSGGPIQSLLLPPGMRSLSASKTLDATGVVSTSLIGSAARPTECVVTPARPGVRVVAVTSQPSGSKPVTTTTPLGHMEVQTPYGLVFNSRTINADGTVCITKEYLCNFCQFKVSTSASLLDHFSTHVFSCNYCSFRSTSRIDVLTHKRDSHPAAADEIAGFGDLSHPSLVAKTNRSTRFGGSGFMSPMIGGIGRPFSNLSGPPAPPRGLVFGVPLTSASAVTTTTAAKLTTVTVSSSSSSIARTIPGKTGDSYFTYRIAHDADGKVQAYECDVCGFRSTRIGEMFSHASTHTLADLAKSGTGSGDIVWECFYCSFTAPQQAVVVSHVIATHPNKPIQLKRLLAGAADGRPADVPPEIVPTSVPVASTAKSVLLDIPQRPDESPSDAAVPLVTPSLKENAVPPTETSSSSSKKTSSNGKPEKKKKTESEESCIWGCYYCPIQSASRNDIICHLKKEHATEKLVVTRRRITHVAGDGNSGENKTKLDEKTGLISTEKGAVPAVAKESTSGSVILKEGGRTRRKLSSVLASETTVGDGDSSDVHQGMNKSRRKQVAPRRVAEDADKSISDDMMLQSPSESTGDNILPDLTLAVKDASSNLAGRDDPMEAVDSLVTPMNPKPSRSSSTGTSSGNRKHGRTTSKYSKYESLIKKLKMAEKEDTKIENSLGLDKLSKNIGMLELSKAAVAGKASTPGGTKAVSLLTGQMVSGYVQPTNATSAASLLISSDAKMPLLQPVNGDLSGRKLRIGTRKTKTGLKVDVMRCVRIRRSGNAQNFVYDDEAKAARCGVCGTTACGKNALPEIREHLAAHFNECRWSCDYCAFQCEQRSTIILHVQHQHRGRPLRVVRRQFSTKSDKKSEKALRPLESDVSLSSKLRGPRTHREDRRLTSAHIMWQCPFCCRRSVFRGFINLHVKVAHADIDMSAAPQTWIRPALDADDKLPDVKPFSITLVRIEDVEHFPTLSDIIVSNGAGLIHELDVDDDDDDKVTKTIATPGDECTLELDYRCLHCHFRGCLPSVVKCHVLHAHPTEDVTFLDMRPTRKQNHEHLFMCKNVECQFVSSVQKEFDRHITIFPSHVSNKVINIVAEDEQRAKRCTLLPSTENRLRLRSPSKSVSVSPHGATESPKQDRHLASSLASLPSSSHSRKTADGPIEYNDDGTIKGFEPESVRIMLKCFHCDYPKTSNLDEIREHLGKAHPRLTPQALNLDVPAGDRPMPFFFCPITNCDFIATFGNVYRHHMQVEHPDSESGSTRSKPLKRKSLGSSVRRQNSGRDVSFTANIRTPKRPVDGMNSRSSDANGSLAFSPTDLSDNGSANLLDLSLQTSDGDSNLSLSAAGSSKKASHYESQAFDFSRRYECIICPFVSATLGDMKMHVTTEHDPSVPHQCIDRRARQLRKRQGVLFCPDIACSFCCKIDKELNAHLRQEHNRNNDDDVADADDMSLSPARTVGSDETSGDRVYQCSHCTYITTDLHNVRIHVVAEHAATDGGFAEIKTAVGKDGNVIMKVNDRGLDDLKDEVADEPLVESVDTKQVDKEGKVYMVL